MSGLADLLEIRPWLLADGATGSNLFDMGPKSGDSPELWNLTHPQAIADPHRRFIDAGADIILTNSFGGTGRRLEWHGAEAQAARIDEAAARIAGGCCGTTPEHIGATPERWRGLRRR